MYVFCVCLFVRLTPTPEARRDKLPSEATGISMNDYILGARRSWSASPAMSPCLTMMSEGPGDSLFSFFLEENSKTKTVSKKLTDDWHMQIHICMHADAKKHPDSHPVSCWVFFSFFSSDFTFSLVILLKTVSLSWIFFYFVSTQNSLPSNSQIDLHGLLFSLQQKIQQVL